MTYRISRMTTRSQLRSCNTWTFGFGLFNYLNEICKIIIFPSEDYCYSLLNLKLNNRFLPDASETLHQSILCDNLLYRNQHILTPQYHIMKVTTALNSDISSVFWRPMLMPWKWHRSTSCEWWRLSIKPLIMTTAINCLIDFTQMTTRLVSHKKKG